MFDVYTRVSDVGGREGESYGSPEVQEAACRRWADAAGRAVGTVVLDEDVSGAVSADDRALGRLIRRIEEGESEGVLVRHLDRFGRDSIAGSVAMKRIVEAGGRLVAVEDGFDSSSEGSTLVFQLRMAIAEDFLRRTKANFVAAQERAVARGVYLAARPPLGYVWGEGKRLVVDEDAAGLVREAFRLRAGGANFGELQRLLGLSKSGARAVVRNRAYVGEATVQNGRRGHPRVIQGAHPPIVTQAEWEAANAVRGAYHPRTGKSREALLSGVARCDGCGKRLRVCAYGPQGGRKNIYSCTERDCGERASMKAERLDEHVWDELQRAISEQRPDVIAVLEGDTRRLAAQDAVEEARAALDEYRDDVRLQRLLGIEDFARGLEARKATLAESRRELAELPPPTSARGLDGGADDLAALYHSSRRDLLRRCVREVRVRPGRGEPGEKATVRWAGEAA